MVASSLGKNSDPAYGAGAFALVIAVAAILAALAFEHVGGYAPCPLCLTQRYAYYAGIPLIFAGLVCIATDRNGWAAALLFLAAVAFLVNAGIGVYHAGAEWKYWPGPDTCAPTSAPVGPGAGGLLKQLETTRVIRCDEAAWRLFGLSFAGWNVVASFLVFVGALQAAFAASARRVID